MCTKEKGFLLRFDTKCSYVSDSQLAVNRPVMVQSDFSSHCLVCIFANELEN